MVRNAMEKVNGKKSMVRNAMEKKVNDKKYHGEENQW